MNQSSENRITGKEFIADLDECATPKEVFNLLAKTMSADIIRDRASNLSNQDVIVSFHAKSARFNIMQGAACRHQDCVEMAADKYCELTGKDIKYFKANLNKDLTAREQQSKTVNPYVMQQWAELKGRA